MKTTKKQLGLALATLSAASAFCLLSGCAVTVKDPHHGGGHATTTTETGYNPYTGTATTTKKTTTY